LTFSLKLILFLFEFALIFLEPEEESRVPEHTGRVGDILASIKLG